MVIEISLYYDARSKNIKLCKFAVMSDCIRVLQLYLFKFRHFFCLQLANELISWSDILMGYSERNGLAAHTLPELVERFPTLQARLSLEV